MGDVISLGEKQRVTKAQRAARVKKQKSMAVQRVFQCIHCTFKCEKCGTQILRDGGKIEKNPLLSRIPYRFCESCAEEYIDYIDRLKGFGDPDCYWRNEIWLQVWKKWIDYQGAIDRYLKSKEFTQLMHELKQPHPDR